MKALRMRKRRVVAPAPIPPTMQIDMDGEWRKFTRMQPKNFEVIGMVTIAGDDHGPLMLLASTGALVKVTGGEVTMLNQSRMWTKLDLLERQQHSPELEMVEVD